jgi:Fe-S-cluster containining protein
MNPEELKIAALKTETSTIKFFSRLKKTKPVQLDDVIQEIHDEIFEETDCLSCANCCKTTSPVFYMKDIERAAKHMKMRSSEFIDKYLHLDEDNDYVLNSSPCSFLDSDNYCSIYESRPTACREYPHTNRKRFYQILDLTLRNTFICPAAWKIVEKLKEKLN